MRQLNAQRKQTSTFCLGDFVRFGEYMTMGIRPLKIPELSDSIMKCCGWCKSIYLLALLP